MWLKQEVSLNVKLNQICMIGCIHCMSYKYKCKFTSQQNKTAVLAP